MGIVGKSGMGKTTYALRYLQGSSHDRVFIFDHQGEFRVRFNAQESQVATDEESFYAAAERHRLVFFDPAVNYGGAFLETFDDFAGLVHEIATQAFEPLGKNCLFVCDEIQKFCKIGAIPPNFKNVLETGRRSMLDSLSLSQRPNKIDADVREQWTEIICFHLSDPNSLKFLDAIGANPDEISGLGPHEFRFFQTQRGEERGGKLDFSA